jgi:hypothetical protein
VLSIIVPIGVNNVFANDGNDILEIESLEYSGTNGRHNSLVQVDSDTYALAYEGTDDNGFISTFTISSDGTSIVQVDNLEHDTVRGQHNSLVHVDSDTYALAYTGEGEDGFISTFTIDSDGNITAVKTQSEGNNLEHDDDQGAASVLHNSLVKVDSNTIALAYAGAGEDGFISTFTIDSDGNITAVKTQSEGNNLEHDDERGQHNSLVQVDSDTYALAYEGLNRDGYISTFTIDSDGNITAVKTESEGNNLEHDANRGSFNALVHVVSDTYALAYTSHGENGFISTFTIDSDGNITAVKTQSEGNNLEHDENKGIYNSLVQVDSDTYALAYTGTDTNGFISTFTISSDGTSIVQVENLEHDTDVGNYNSLVQVDSDTYALAYTSGQKDGWIMTFTIPEDVEVEHKPQGGPCGQYSDCIKPSIVKHGVSVTQDGFSINDNIFEENQERYNKNPTIQGTVGEPVTIKVRAWENMGTDRISLAITYLGMHEEKPDWTDSTANIKFKIQQDEFKVYDKDKIFSAVGVETEKVIDPYGDNPALEVLDITFTIFFAKPMEPSHIGIQTIDLITNYEFVYFENALEILPREIVQVEEIPEAVPEDMPQEVPEPEEIPKEIPEPPVKEPEPEVILTATTEKTVLSFVDENMPAKHYVKRYITEIDYKEWFDVNYSEYKFWEGIGITQERFDELTLEIELEPEPRIIETGFVLAPDNQKSFPLVEEIYEPEPVELEPVKEKKGFFDWLFSLLG